MRRDLPAGRHEARRAHLMSELSAPRRSFRSRAYRRRVVFGGLAAGGLAAGVAVAVVVPAGSGHRAPALVNVGATEVLTRASRAAAARPDLRPRPDQFLYVESRVYQRPGPDPKVEPGQAGVRRAWQSIDGRRAGLVRGSGVSGVGGGAGSWLCTGSEALRRREIAAIRKGRDLRVDLAHPPTGCRDEPARLSGMPTGVEGMRRWLYERSRGSNPPDVQAFVTVGDSIRERYVEPRTLSLLFAAAARVPGVTVTRGVTDMVGRKGVAVGQTWQGVRHELVFDARTYAYLGEREVVDLRSTWRPAGASPSPSPSGRVGALGEHGALVYASAEVRVAVTDRAGQLPR
ncbi:CU044_5270 family protein [Actinomadura yumaensis]|uniref:CU044_5270 family protein n=1 Tax=Actinomadura yumaensis TaxID=111807 RepID=UPI00360FB7E3